MRSGEIGILRKEFKSSCRRVIISVQQMAMEIYERIKGKYYARFVNFADGMAEALK